MTDFRPLFVFATSLLVFGSCLLWSCGSGTLDPGDRCHDGEIIGPNICIDGQWEVYDGPCAEVNCGLYGDCVDDGESASCDCDDGFVDQNQECIPEDGDNDSQPTDPCESYNCEPNGVCVATGEEAHCDCDDGFEAAGNSCIEEGDEDPCQELSCEPDGVCDIDSNGDARCDCHSGYEPSGDGCVHQCEAFDCEPNGECVLDVDGNAQCSCNTGYEPAGNTCIEAGSDPCDAFNCSPGTCQVTGGGAAYCDCPTGYYQSGTTCVAEPTDPCDGVTCGANGTCVDQGGTATCDCDDGYQSDGLDCVAVPPQCQGTCTVHVLNEGQNSYTVTDYADTDLGDALDGPIVAAFNLEDTTRAYLLTENSYYRINTDNFSVIDSGPHSDIHADLPAATALIGAHSVPERHGSDETVGQGNDTVTFHQNPDNTYHHHHLSFHYNYSQASFEELTDDDGNSVHDGWQSNTWEQDVDPENVPAATDDILATWLDDENHRGFLDSNVQYFCGAGETDTVGIPYLAVLTQHSVHYVAASACFPFAERQPHSSAAPFAFSNAPTPSEIGAAFWHDRSMYFFHSGYYD